MTMAEQTIEKKTNYYNNDIIYIHIVCKFFI